jgi:hypothetical protein
MWYLGKTIHLYFKVQATMVTGCLSVSVCCPVCVVCLAVRTTHQKYTTVEAFLPSRAGWVVALCRARLDSTKAKDTMSDDDLDVDKLMGSDDGACASVHAKGTWQRSRSCAAPCRGGGRGGDGGVGSGGGLVRVRLRELQSGVRQRLTTRADRFLCMQPHAPHPLLSASFH